MARWIEDIVQAMRNLGGQAKYAELYEEVRRVRNGPLSKECKATVRRTVENHSSDSKNYKDHRTDYFYSVHGKGRGVWALRQEHRNESSTGSKTKDPKEAYQVESSEVTLTQYERDTGARKECLDHYGYECSVCNFDFESFYGPIGKGFIHVHHLIPISKLDEDYEIDPVQDLRPVCPNCHAMLHQEDPPVTIEELRRMIKD